MSINSQPAQGWNPRYLAYCQAQGRTPEEQLAHDRQRWPGGQMCGFILWCSGMWATWERIKGSRLAAWMDQAGFDRMVSAMLGGHAHEPEQPTRGRK